MKDRIHEQMTMELKTGIRVDTVVVLATIFLNLFLGGLASVYAVAANTSNIANITAITFILLALIVVIDIVAIAALLKGRERVLKIINGLLKINKEEGVDEYYDPSLIKAYHTRYLLFASVVCILGLVSIVIPLLLFLTPELSLF